MMKVMEKARNAETKEGGKNIEENQKVIMEA